MNGTFTDNAFKIRLQEGIEQHCFTGAQLVIQQGSDQILNVSVGMTKQKPSPGQHVFCNPALVDSSTLFDVASVTKVLSTTSLVMHAVEEGKLSLSQKLISVSPGVLPPWLLEYTIADLLTHATALKAWDDFTKKSISAKDHFSATSSVLYEIFKSTPRTDTSQCCYSDLGFIILGSVLENLYGSPLDVLFKKYITEPLGLSADLTYLPLHGSSQTRCAATHLHCGEPLQGHPDDDNTRILCHVAGHAGVFATASAIGKFCSALLEDRFPVSPKLVHKFLTYESPRSTFALGWDRPTSSTSLSARGIGDPVVGHLGYTGCSVWMDLMSKRSVILLTNRSHVNNDPSSLADLRREIYAQSWNYSWA